MIEELQIAAQFGQKIIIRLQDWEKITGKVEPTCYPDSTKIQTIWSCVDAS